ncbi:MAG: hypothetical protein H0T73_12130 [Ardenticatenales bacterium]|nr:hypothetical protein [Ardenticatenales bacterium]
MSEQLEVSLSLDAVRPLLEAAAAELGLHLDFLMRQWNGRFATYNIGVLLAEVVDPRRGVHDQPRAYRLIGRLKANSRAGTLHLTVNSPTSCDLTPTEADEALWASFVERLRQHLAGGNAAP